MKLFAFAILDTATQAYGSPIFNVHNNGMLRALRDEVNRAETENQLYKHPHDFICYAIGSFDTETGIFDAFAQPEMLVRAEDLVDRSSN